MVFVAAAISLLCFAHLPAVLGHARVSSPPIRSPGQNFLQQCGQTSFNSVQGDPTGHIEEQEPVNAGCDLTLCRGMPFSDVPASNVQTVTASQAMAMSVDCTIPHGGPANVSLVDTTTGGSGSIIGGFLKTFDDFCPTSGPTPSDQTNLQFTLPNAATIGNKCQTAGDCVVQLFWATPDFTQRYFYCVDVVMAATASTSATVVQATSIAVPTPTTTIFPTSPAAAASSSSALRMITSATNAAATALPIGAVNSTAPSSVVNNAGRRRVRILWF